MFSWVEVILRSIKKSSCKSAVILFSVFHCFLQNKNISYHVFYYTSYSPTRELLYRIIFTIPTHPSIYVGSSLQVKIPHTFMKHVTNQTQLAVSDLRWVKTTHFHTILIHPTLLPSVVEKMSITIKHAFWSQKASFFWVMAWAFANMVHLCHFPLLTVLYPFSKERQAAFPQISNSQGN